MNSATKGDSGPGMSLGNGPEGGRICTPAMVDARFTGCNMPNSIAAALPVHLTAGSLIANNIRRQGAMPANLPGVSHCPRSPLAYSLAAHPVMLCSPVTLASGAPASARVPSIPLM